MVARPRTSQNWKKNTLFNTDPLEWKDQPQTSQNSKKNTLFNTDPLEWKDQHLNIVYTSVACAIGPSVNPLQNRETQHVNIVFAMYVSSFWTAKYKRKSCLNWMASLKCYHVLNWLFVPKPGFLVLIWIFSSRIHLKINISHILNPNLTK